MDVSKFLHPGVYSLVRYRRRRKWSRAEAWYGAAVRFLEREVNVFYETSNERQRKVGFWIRAGWWSSSLCLRAQAGLRPSCFVSFPLSLLGRFPSLFLVPLQILRRDAFSFFLFQSFAFARWRQRVMDSNPDIVIDVNFVLFNAPRIFSDVSSHCAFLRRSYYSIRIAATQSNGHIRRRFVQGRSKLPSLASGTLVSVTLSAIRLLHQ